MKTLQDLYTEIVSSDELKKAFVEAVKSDSVEAFLEAQGCDATIDEVEEFLAQKAEEDLPLSLSPEELAKVAGGDGVDSILTQTVKCSGKDTCDCSNTCIRDCC